MAVVDSEWPDLRFDVVKEAYSLSQRHWAVWAIATLLVVIGVVGADRVLFVLFHFGRARFAVQSVLHHTVLFFCVGCMIRMAARQVRGGVPRIDDLFTITDVWFDLLLVSFLYSLGILLGGLLLVIPGFIVFGLGMLAIPLVVEGKLPAVGALIQSVHALKSQWFSATLLHPVLFVAGMSGMILCGIGVLFTAPLYCLSIALLYRHFFPVPPSQPSKPLADPFPEV